MQRRPPDENEQDRNHQRNHDAGRDDHRLRKSKVADRGHQQGYADDAGEAGAVQRQADRHAALAVEPQAERVVDHAQTHAGPTAGEYGIGEVKLPRRVDLADADGGQRGRAGPRDQAIARAEFPHPLRDEDHDHRAEQIEERGGAGHQRGRPAICAVQFGEIDALAVEAECPAEGGDQEADGDDAPALIAARAFVDGDVRGCVQGNFLVFRSVACLGQRRHPISGSLVMPGLVPGIHVLAAG